MSVESGGPDLNTIESKLTLREPKLPDGIKKHIRRLKEQGKLQEAFQVRKQALERKTPRQKLEDTLNENIRKAVLSDDPIEQATGEFVATWIVSKRENLSTEERIMELQKVYANHPDQDAYLEAIGPRIVHEVSSLVLEAENS